MAIAFVAAAGGATGALAATTQVLNVPAGTLDNHVMVAMVSLRGTASTDYPITAPAGWDLVQENFDVGTPNIRQNWYSRVASSEPASYTWTSTNGLPEYWVGHVLTYSGVNRVTPVHAANTDVQGTGSATRVTPAIDVTARECWVVSGFTDRSGSTWTGPDTERDERLSGNSSASSVICDTNGTVTPAAGITKTATASVSSSVAVNALIALHAALPAPPPPFLTPARRAMIVR